jgi:hypothetical protein
MVEIAKNRGSESRMHYAFLLDVINDMELEIEALER